MMFLIALASYLHQKYSTNIHFNALDESENGHTSENDRVEHKEFSVQYYGDKILDKINELKLYIEEMTAPTATSSTTSTKTKKKKTKKPKTKVKIPLTLSEVQDTASEEDEETGTSNYNQHSNKNPSKTQNLYAGSTSKVTGYTTSESALNTIATTPPSSTINTGNNSSIHNNNMNMDDSSSNDQKGMDMSTSFSGRAARKHPSQV
jgi:hypothetical protein